MIPLLLGAILVVSPPLSASQTSVQANAGAVLIDINSATLDQLKTLVGIGDTYAKRIVEGRPYQRTDELVTKKVIPQTTYDKIKDQIITRPN
jgi:DNA uptake protein ComE-like DNA-binding protein